MKSIFISSLIYVTILVIAMEEQKTDTSQIKKLSDRLKAHLKIEEDNINKLAERGDVVALMTKFVMSFGSSQQEFAKWCEYLNMRMTIDTPWLTTKQINYTRDIFKNKRINSFDSNDPLQVQDFILRTKMQTQALNWLYDLVLKDACTGVEWRKLIPVNEENPKPIPSANELQKHRLIFLQKLSGNNLDLKNKSN